MRIASLLLGLLSLGALARAESPVSDVPADAILADLPFLDSPERNRVIVDLAPKGDRPFRLMLDTGATNSVLTPGYARELGVTVRRHRDRPNEKETVLGRSLQFWIDTESSDTGSRTGWEYGLLGGDFLAEYVLELDFSTRRVRFLDAGRFKVPDSVGSEREAVLPLRVTSNRPFVRMEIDAKPVEVLLDTGAPLGLLLSGAGAKRAEYEWKPIVRIGGGGVLGPIESYLCEVKTLGLGPFRFASAPIVVAPKGAYNMGGNTDSLLGYEVLSHFRVRIDYPRKRLWLRREGDGALAWFGVPWAAVQRTGLLASVSGESLDVEAVLPDGAAEKLGVRAGDSIALAGEGDTTAKVNALYERIDRGERITVARDANGVLQDRELGGSPPPAP